MLETREQDGVRTLSMVHGKANAFDTELLAALQDSLAAAESDAIKAVVLTGSGSIFSAGVDLFRVVDGGRDYLETFLPALSGLLSRLFSFPKPVIAAINGHAIAGGCILACACDRKVGVRGSARIGVPELRVGVPFPAAALHVVRFAVGNARLAEMVLGGETYTPDRALDLGFLDRLVDPEDLLECALVEARQLARLGRHTFALTKSQLRRKTAETMRIEGERSDADVLAVWSDSRTQAKIRAYVDRTLGSR